MTQDFDSSTGGALLNRRTFVVSLLSASLSSTSFNLSRAANSLGSFKGEVVAKWLNDGRNMKLVKPFEYTDPKGRRWPVPSGVIVDGASIPSVFWSIIGGPFEGLYRNPSVVHDYYCDHRTRRYEDVHRVFYDAMLCAGVGPKKALLMYEAVAQFGPRWDDPKTDRRCEHVDKNYDFERCARNAIMPDKIYPPTSKADLEKFANSIEGQVDPEDIAKLRKTIADAP